MNNFDTYFLAIAAVDMMLLAGLCAVGLRLGSTGKGLANRVAGPGRRGQRLVQRWGETAGDLQQRGLGLSDRVGAATARVVAAVAHVRDLLARLRQASEELRSVAQEASAGTIAPSRNLLSRVTGLRRAARIAAGEEAPSDQT